MEYMATKGRFFLCMDSLELKMIRVLYWCDKPIALSIECIYIL